MARLAFNMQGAVAWVKLVKGKSPTNPKKRLATEGPDAAKLVACLKLVST